MTPTPAARRTSRFAALGIGAAGLTLLAAGRMPWLVVTAADDKSGTSIVDMTGSVWSPELSPLAWMLLAASVAGFALRRTGRRIIGLLAALASIGGSWAPLNVLAGQPDPQRAHAILTAGTATSQTTTARISQWATIDQVDVSSAGVILALVACAIGLVAGIVLSLKPGTDSAKRSAYEVAAARREKLTAELARVGQQRLEDDEEPVDEGRVLWDALDNDLDPTDTDETTDSRS